MIVFWNQSLSVQGVQKLELLDVDVSDVYTTDYHAPAYVIHLNVWCVHIFVLC